MQSKNPYIAQSFSLHQVEHFARPKVKNVETSIFLNRLIGIFEILMSKLEFAATIPTILAHPETLETMDRKDLKQVVAALSRYYDTGQSTDSSEREDDDPEGLTIYKDECDCSYKSGKTVISDRQSADIYNAFQILSSYPAVLQLSHSTNLSTMIPKITLNFLRQLKFFMEHAIERVRSSPEEERDRQLRYRRVCGEIERAKSDIAKLTETLQEQKSGRSEELRQIEQELDKAVETWGMIVEEFEAWGAKIVEDSADNLAKARQDSDERMEQLRRAHDSLKAKVDGERQRREKQESDVQGKKFKVESQLTGIMTKYDTEMADREVAYDALLAEYSELDKERQRMMAEVEEQLTIYNGIVREREEKEFAEYRERCEGFVRNRSARIIQRWWKSVYWKVKSARKKKGKKKKKKGKGK